MGKILVLDLQTAARARGFGSFRAWVVADNARMLGLLARYTDIRRRKIESGVVEIVFTAPATADRSARSGP